jgi:16S rRNA (cytidine1402-2'-O)-methyltransferase
MKDKDNKRNFFLIPVFLSPDNSDSILAPLIKEVILHVNYFLVEDIRTARRFISKMKTGRVIEDLIFFQVDKRTSEVDVKKILSEVPAGEDIGIMSEAGCPGIADPGSVIITLAHNRNDKVVPLPGPSSIFLALMASGFNGQNFCFTGYLPISRIDRVKALKDLEKKADEGITQIFMETPYRNNHLLDDIVKELKGETKLCIASEITGNGEFIRTKPLAEWRKSSLPDLGKKPTVFLLSK